MCSVAWSFGTEWNTAHLGDFYSFSISPSNEYSGLISFRMDLNLLAVQRTLESPLQYHSSKPSILRRSAFFIVQLSHPYMTPGSRGTDLNRDLGLKQDLFGP